MHGSHTNRLLGYAPDARLLIVNADDFGMSEAVNAGVMRAITEGVARSASLMVPWPAANHAMRMLADNPGVHAGVHLSVICDMPGYHWGPLTPADKVPSLLDESGMFYGLERRAEFVQRARLGELEREYRAQIEAVLAAGLRPTHLDWHCLADGGRPDVFDMTLRLASDYGLALRAHARASIGKLRALGLPANDHEILDSYGLGGDPAGKSECYMQMLHDLPPGLSEWAVHPAVDRAEQREIEPAGWQVRHADYAFLVSAQAREAIEREGIVLLSHEPVRKVWAANSQP